MCAQPRSSVRTVSWGCACMCVCMCAHVCARVCVHTLELAVDINVASTALRHLTLNTSGQVGWGGSRQPAEGSLRFHPGKFS